MQCSITIAIESLGFGLNIITFKSDLNVIAIGAFSEPL